MLFCECVQVAKQFGNVFSLRWGTDKIVFVSGHKMVKDVLVTQGDIFLDRPLSPLFNEVFKGRGKIFKSNCCCCLSCKCLFLC